MDIRAATRAAVLAMTDEEIKGKVVSQEDKTEFESLRTIFDPKAALDRLDSYGKWLFASAAVVGSLGAGLSNTALSKLRGPGVWVFALAVVALGICLVAASRSIAPHWAKARVAELDSLRAAINTQFKTRQHQLNLAAGFFALALVLAAVSPLVSLITGASVPVLHYSLDEKGSLDAGLEANGLDPGTTIEIRLDGPKGSAIQLPSAAATADDNGQVKLSLKMTGISSTATSVDLVSCVKKRDQTACEDRQRLSVRR
jgi:hypothetical protein